MKNEQVSKIVLGGLLLASALPASTLSTLAGYSGEAAVPRLDVIQLMEGGAPENEALKRFLLSAPANSASLAGKRIALLSTDGVEEIELTGTVQALRARGAQVEIVAPRYQPLPRRLGVQYPAQRATHILTARFMETATWVKIDRFLGDVQADRYDAVVIGGGAWNPDTLRLDANALTLLKDATAAGKVVAAICHGPLVLVNAGLLKGKHATSYWNVQLDLKNAGALVEDSPVVVDGKLITSRFPTDLPQFVTAIESALQVRR